MKLPRKITRTKLIRRSLTVVLALYFLGYLALTSFGTYRGPYPPSGKQEYTNGVWMLKHTYIWQPKFTRFDWYGNYNLLGAIYCPLIVADRSIWHRDQQSSP